jgi:hypothetical protein
LQPTAEEEGEEGKKLLLAKPGIYQILPSGKYKNRKLKNYNFTDCMVLDPR